MSPCTPAVSHKNVDKRESTRNSRTNQLAPQKRRTQRCAERDETQDSDDCPLLHQEMAKPHCVAVRRQGKTENTNSYALKRNILH